MIFGTLPTGEQVELIELKSDILTARITNYGARILSVDKDGDEFVVGPKTFDEMLSDTCYCGAICGRVANRIDKGQFDIDGNRFQVAVNNGPNHLHGGIHGFDSKIWQIQEVSPCRVIMTLTSPDDEENYPGKLEIVATYTLCDESLHLKMEAYSDETTIVNLTNHVYWNLSHQANIDDMNLQVNASAYTPKDSTGIPDGRILPVVGTAFDLTAPAVLGERNSRNHPATADGFDHNFVLNTESGDKIAAILRDPHTGHRLILATDAPGLQVYTGEYLPNSREGIALEAQDFPNAINVPHFPSIILRPGDSKVRNITWTIK